MSKCVNIYKVNKTILKFDILESKQKMSKDTIILWAEKPRILVFLILYWMTWISICVMAENKKLCIRIMCLILKAHIISDLSKKQQQKLCNQCFGNNLLHEWYSLFYKNYFGITWWNTIIYTYVEKSLTLFNLICLF